MLIFKPSISISIEFAYADLKLSPWITMCCRCVCTNQKKLNLRYHNLDASST